MIGHLYQPVITATTYDLRGRLVHDGLGFLWGDTYSHVLSVSGGMLSASFQLAGSRHALENWMNYLGYHVETFSSTLAPAFQGFINQITYKLGSYQVVIGPLTEVRNRVAVLYTPIFDETATPPLQGSQRVTTYAENTVSQYRYGLFVEFYTGGTCLDNGTVNEAEEYRNLALAEQAYPPTTGEVSFSSSEQGTVDVEVLGYYERLKAQYYEDATTASIAVSAKVLLALAQDAYGMFSVATGIETNARLVSREEAGIVTIADVIETLRRGGDAAANPWVFEIGWNQVPRFYPQPSTIDYQWVAGHLERFPSGQYLEPWEICPARWVFIPSLLVGREQPQPDGFRKDPRMEYIESITVNGSGPPEITGSKYGRLDQFLAQREGT